MPQLIHSQSILVVNMVRFLILMPIMLIKSRNCLMIVQIW
nr:MAG TPA: hypothetical protein [Caudoviricetes sp.]